MAEFKDKIVDKQRVNLLKAIAKPGEHDILDMSRVTGITYSRVSNIVMQLAEKGVVEKNRSKKGPGRKLDVSITEKGRALISCIDKIKEIINGKEVENGTAN